MMMLKAFQLIKRLFKDYPRSMLLTLLLTVLSGLFEGVGVSLFIPLLSLLQGPIGSSQGGMQLLVKNVFAALGLPFSLASVLLFILAVFLIQSTTLLLQQHVAYKLAYRYQYDLRQKLFSAYMSSRWQFFLANKIGHLANGLVSEPIRTNDAFYALLQVFSLSVISFIYIILALVLSWQMTLMILAIGALVLVSLRKKLNRAHEYGQSITDANSRLQMEAIEFLSGAKIIKSQNLEPNALSRFEQALKNVAVRNFGVSINIAWVRILYEISVIALLCLTIYTGVQLFAIPFPTLVVFLLAFYRLSPRIGNVQSSMHQFLANIPGLEEIEQLGADAGAQAERRDGRKFDGLTGGITFKDVDFSYQPNKAVLSGINLEVPKNQIVAIVGRSGSGKSTMIDLMVGLIEPNKGQVFVDDRFLTEYSLDSWRRKIGYVPQEAFLFHDSVYSNIAWAATDIGPKDVVAAARLANAHEFIEQLSNGYDTIVGDRGVRLSGGQRQRLALARALVRKPAILILDEATSSLDSESEGEIQKAIDSLAGNITIIIVTHRLSTVQNADTIYVLDEGLLIESGPWDKLVSTEHGHFQKMQKLQLI